MNNIDHLGLDGYTLRTFLTVLDEMSVSRAAERLDVSQSAVSHTLDKLRAIFEDPLFVRVGRGIEPTSRARALRGPVESVLDDLKSLTSQPEFNPLTNDIEFTVATNDFPLQFIFPKLLKELYEEGINPRIRFIPAGIPSVGAIRASRFQMLITPTPPDNEDYIKVSLLQAKMVCFYDQAVRTPPTTWKEYVNSKHVEVRFSDTESSIMALPLLDTSTMDRPVITVPNFSSLTPIIRGTDRITTQLAVMKLGLLQDLDWSPLPFETQALDLFLIWHRRDNADPAHQWLRQRIIGTVSPIIKDALKGNGALKNSIGHHTV